MLRIVFAVCLTYNSETKALNFSFLQSDYTLAYERVELLNYSSEYFSDIKIKNYKLTRNQAVSDMTFTVMKDIPNPFKIEVQAYKFMSNEYRHFPVRFSYPYCEALRFGDFGMANLFKCGNISRAGCPYKKGTYRFCKFFLDGEKFPPHVPQGSYMVDIKWFIGNKEVEFLQGYGTIKYKNFWEN